MEPAISETVPAAFGLFIANNGETMQSIYGGVNIGDETRCYCKHYWCPWRGHIMEWIPLLLDIREIIEKQNGMDWSCIWLMKSIDVFKVM